METIGSAQLCKETGATYRQIDVWCRYNIIHPVGFTNPGSGSRREFNTNVIGPLKLLVDVSNTFDHRVTKPMLRKIFDSYDKGSITFETGLTLSWRYCGANASPERSN